MPASLALRLPAPFRVHGDHIMITLRGASVLFTTRRGGVSQAPYNALNLGRQTEDDPSRVASNRALVAGIAQLGCDRLADGLQVHGSEVRRVTDVADIAPKSLLEVDGHATALADVAPLVVTADCLPIAVAGDRAVAMLHGGWRGLSNAIVAEGVRALRELGEEGDLAAAIGPGAGPCCYEVGNDVHEAFASHGDGVRNGRQLDLPAVARIQLAAAGVGEVYCSDLCTICTPTDLFFSHRRDGPKTGRQAGVAWLN
ncbi:MAG: polyphenol oxidase family protein [Solirubrobacterales bacterium]|nr:polyphenol oxidase family protein [Solirubrobacterales bacterium]